MAHYSLERRESVVRRMLSNAISMSGLARETGITETTLYRWRASATPNGGAVSATRKPSEKLAPAHKLAVVVETFTLNEAELSEYCRTKGLYPEHIKAWRVACEQATGNAMVSAQALRAAVAAEKKRIKDLERELHRKDRALAETAALLTLRKKAAAIWGEGKDE